LILLGRAFYAELANDVNAAKFRIVYSCNLSNIIQLIVIVISKFLKRYSKTKRSRAPSYSQALRKIKGDFPKGGGQEKLCSDFQNIRRGQS